MKEFNAWWNESFKKNIGNTTKAFFAIFTFWVTEKQSKYQTNPFSHSHTNKRAKEDVETNLNNAPVKQQHFSSSN